MHPCALVTLIVGLSLLTEVSSTYFIEIGGGNQLAKDNEERRKQAYLPVLAPGLYTCNNRPLDNGASAMWCRGMDMSSEKIAYNSATFFTAYKPELDIGQTLFIDGQDMIELPEVLVVGFNLFAVDTPGIDAVPATDDEVICLVAKYANNGCLPDDVKLMNDLLDYLRCNDVKKCILKHPRRTIRRYFPAVRIVLSRVRTLYDMFLEPEEKPKKQSFLRKAFESVTKTISKPKTLSKPKTISKFKFKSKSRPRFRFGSKSPSSPSEGPTPTPMELMSFMKLMLNKMLDPCLLMEHAQTEKDKATINQNCNVYCQFLSTAYDAFTGWFGSKCGFIKTGMCTRGLCVCDQILGPPYDPGRRKIRMLYCNNMFRRKVNDADLTSQPPSEDERGPEFEDWSDQDGFPSSSPDQQHSHGSSSSSALTSESSDSGINTLDGSMGFFGHDFHALFAPAKN